SAPALTDLMAGRLHYMFDGVSTSLGYLQAGTIRALGVAGAHRSPVLPDRPTISEAGLPGYDTMVWFGLFAPAGTPKSIILRVNSATNAVLASPRVKEASTAFVALFTRRIIDLGVPAGANKPNHTIVS